MATYTQQPSGKDNSFNSNEPTVNNGTLTTLYLATYAPQNMRDVLYFDISAIPSLAASSDISSAKLNLYYYNLNGDAVGLTTWAYKVTRDDWVETTSCWTNYKTATAWTSAGGDYVTSSPAGGSVAMPAGYGWVEWDIINIVKDAVDNVSKHVNVIIRFETESNATFKSAHFYSNNYVVDTSLCPKLVITYTPITTISVTDNPKTTESITQEAEFASTFTETIIPSDAIETLTEKNFWTKKTKNAASFTNKTKNTTSFTNKTKNTTTFTGKTKH